jgi:hypothetical protein
MFWVYVLDLDCKLDETLLPHAFPLCRKVNYPALVTSPVHTSSLLLLARMPLTPAAP